MTLQQAQELVGTAVWLLLSAAALALVVRGLIGLFYKRAPGRRKEAEILCFISAGRRKGCCPVVNLEENGGLYPVAVKTAKPRWREKPGERLAVRIKFGGMPEVTLWEQPNRRLFAVVQIVIGSAFLVSALAYGLFGG